MRFFCLSVLLSFMAWTFSLSQFKRSLPLSSRSLILRELQESMVEFLQENIPGVQNIRFLQAYTKTLRPGKQITAYFKYSYEIWAPGAQRTKEVREGEFDLTSKDGGSTWEPRAKNFRDLNLEFLEELVISP